MTFGQPSHWTRANLGAGSASRGSQDHRVVVDGCLKRCLLVDVGTAEDAGEPDTIALV